MACRTADGRQRTRRKVTLNLLAHRRDSAQSGNPCPPSLSTRAGAEALDVFHAGFCFGFGFKLHVTKFFGVKDLATIQALDKFSVFVPGDDAYPGMSADGCHCSWC